MMTSNAAKCDNLIAAIAVLPETLISKTTIISVIRFCSNSNQREEAFVCMLGKYRFVEGKIPH